MPNHVSCFVTAEGPDAAAFFAAATAAPDEDFIGHLVPMPKEIKELHSGSVHIDGKIHRVWRDVEGPDGKTVHVAVPEIELAHITDLYGTTDWYQWTRAHWGTKWGAYEVDHTKDGFLFDSAWSPPMAAIEAISSMFPNAHFTLAYAEGGSCFWGTAVFSNGGLLDSSESDQFWKEDADWDDEDVDHYDNLTPVCRAHLERWGLHVGG